MKFREVSLSSGLADVTNRVTLFFFNSQFMFLVVFSLMEIMANETHIALGRIYSLNSAGAPSHLTEIH